MNKDLGFTKTQTERIYIFLKNLNECNVKLNSNCKVLNIDMYVDNQNNFVSSYLLKSFGTTDGFSNDVKYILINPKGEKINMLDIYENEQTIDRALLKMKKIEL